MSRTGRPALLGLLIAGCTPASEPYTLLTFIAEPASVRAGEIVEPPVALGLVDPAGELRHESQRHVTLTLVGGPDEGHLEGTVLMQTDEGVAVFDDLVIRQAGERYTLVATAPSTQTATSSPFTVTAADPTQAHTTFEASREAAVADGVSPVTLTLIVRDAYRNVVPRARVALTTDTPHTWLRPTQGRTDQDGVFSASLTATEPGIRNITAVVDEAFALQVAVTFLPVVIPVIHQVEPAHPEPGGPLRLDGIDFGDEPGEVRIGSETAAVEAWDDETVLVRVPAGALGPTDLQLFTSYGQPSGLHPVIVRGPGVWLPIAKTDMPPQRWGHTAVWTGTEMIVWGGFDGETYRDDGGRYDPVTDTWSKMTGAGAPSPRIGHTAVWTGGEMIVWGGHDESGGFGLSTGGRYDPATDTWTEVSDDGAPTPRHGHTAVWTGAEMVVWGGWVALGTGASYDPARDRWRPITVDGAPSGRTAHTAVWTGTEMVVWGGGRSDTGGRYDPVGDVWQPTTTEGAPSDRDHHTAVWTGTEMIVWGGRTVSSDREKGGRYDPASDRWTPTTTEWAPGGRAFHTAVWTGSQMVVWGGEHSSWHASYDPARDRWTPVSADGVPADRLDHTAVWTGAEMIVWGGRDREVACPGGSGDERIYPEGECAEWSWTLDDAGRYLQ